MIIAVVGAGGKTTICNRIASGLAGKNRKTLFTTTTKIACPQSGHVYVGPAQGLSADGPLLTAAKAMLPGGKLEGYTPSDIETLSPLFDHIIVEADGAKRKPVKCPNETEPVYPLHTGLIIGVIGLDVLGKPLTDEFVHRKELFADVTNAHIGGTVTAGHILRLILHPNGLFRHAPADTGKIVFLNQYDKIDDTKAQDIKAIVKGASLPVWTISRDTDWFSVFYAQYFGKD